MRGLGTGARRRCSRSAIAATTGPTPNSSVTEVRDARTAVGDTLLRRAELFVDAAQVLEMLEREVVAGAGHRIGRGDAVEEPLGPIQP